MRLAKLLASLRCCEPLSESGNEFLPRVSKETSARLPDPGKMAGLIDELVDETQVVQRLQRLIDQF